MRSLAIRDGDFVIEGRSLLQVGGEDHLRQRLAHALQEPYGGDRFHRRWGSTLANYVGRPAGSEMIGLIQAEVHRVIGIHRSLQRMLVERAFSEGKPSPLTDDESIAEVTAVDVRQEQDRFLVRVRLRTINGGDSVLVLAVR